MATSQVGVEMAKKNAKEKNLSDRVDFALADATNNGLPDASFDRVWSLESAHLMPDKEALFRECCRVLRPEGKLVLCDVSLVGKLTGDRGEIEGYRMLGRSPWKNV